MKIIYSILLLLIISGCSGWNISTHTDEKLLPKDWDNPNMTISEELFTAIDAHPESFGTGDFDFTCIRKTRIGMQKVYIISGWNMKIKEYMGQSGGPGEPCLTFYPSWEATKVYDIPLYYITGNKVLRYAFGYHPEWLGDETEAMLDNLSSEEAHTQRQRLIKDFFNELEYQYWSNNSEAFKPYEILTHTNTQYNTVFTAEHIEFVPYHKPISFSDLDDEFKAQGIEFRQQDPNEREPYEWQDPIIKNPNHEMILKWAITGDYIYFFKAGHPYYYRYYPYPGGGAPGPFSAFGEIELFVD